MFLSCIVLITLSVSVMGQSDVKAKQAPTMSDAKVKSDTDQETRASEWVASLHLNDVEKETRLKGVLAKHLKTIRDWHNDHPYTTVPAGINPVTGKPLSELDRQIIANSAMPKTVHEELMNGLRKDLTAEQVETILDKYTIGKVAFTMAGYRAIVPNITEKEEAVILANLKEAREQAVDFKNMNQISAIFEIYKTKSEQYLDANGRNWKEMYKAYTDAVRAKKAAASSQPPR